MIGAKSSGQPLGKNELGRKRASALIAKIPLILSQYIARVYHPTAERAA